MLFEAMVAAGLPRQVGPIAMMLQEHEEGRAFTRGMREAAVRLAAGDVVAQGDVVHNATGYASLLRQHIRKEDGVLFPMADQIIPPADQRAVEEGFEHVEHAETGEGVHEKYLALADALVREAVAK